MMFLRLCDAWPGTVEWVAQATMEWAGAAQEKRGKRDGDLVHATKKKETVDTNFKYYKLHGGQKTKSKLVGIWCILLPYIDCLHFLCQSAGLVVRAFEYSIQKVDWQQIFTFFLNRLFII